MCHWQLGWDRLQKVKDFPEATPARPGYRGVCVGPVRIPSGKKAYGVG
jgi:hypothetical protein